jgi:DNA-binding CsgD family transcriptional regulator
MATLESDIARLAARGLDAHTLRVEAMERIRRVVDVDGYCFVSVDPRTLAQTSVATWGVDRRGAPLIYRNEYEQPDVAKHADLATSRHPVRVLSQATKGRPERSARYRELLAPWGIPHELRAAVRERGTTWGFIHLYRGDGRRDFDADEAAVVERATRAIAPVLRAAVVGRAQVPAAQAPALVILDGLNGIAEATGGGHAWLDALRDPADPEQAVPEVLVTLSTWARAIACHGSDDVARAVMPGRDGAWYSLHAAATGAERVAVIVQPARGAELVPLLLSRHGLTRAEQEVTELVLQGRSTKEIAGDLVISPHTVQDRLKAVFEKVGVRSRRELVAQLNSPA